MKVCIIGGGTTGWWCAGYMEKFLPDDEITLIESDQIPIVGVGESTLPMIKTFFDKMGMDETTWMPQCHAIHKYGNVKSALARWRPRGTAPARSASPRRWTTRPPPLAARFMLTPS